MSPVAYAVINPTFKTCPNWLKTAFSIQFVRTHSPLPPFILNSFFFFLGDNPQGLGYVSENEREQNEYGTS